MTTRNDDNPVSIVGIGTAQPRYQATQSDLARAYESYLTQVDGDLRAARRARLAFRRAQVETRRFVLPDFVHPTERLLYSPDAPVPTTSARLRVFDQHGIDLAESACRKALASAEIEPEQISHVVIATCTGVGARDFDVRLCGRLGLSSNAERSQIVWMSCTAGFPALRCARYAASARPGSYTLVVCIELCSLHVQTQDSMGSILAHSLFSDGAAAVVLAGHHESDDALAVLHGSRTEMLTDHRDKLRWEFSDTGFRAHIDPELPELIGANVAPFVRKLGDEHLERTRAWVVHPGGSAILDEVERAMGLDAEALATSRAVLRERGNMSSATVFHVLERKLAACAPGDLGIMLGFGTGLTFEGLPFTRGGRTAPRVDR